MLFYFILNLKIIIFQIIKFTDIKKMKNNIIYILSKNIIKLSIERFF